MSTQSLDIINKNQRALGTFLLSAFLLRGIYYEITDYGSGSGHHQLQMYFI
jgi:hypothetical protein